MKRYVRTQDNKIIDLNSGEYIVNGQDLILHKKYETVGGHTTIGGSYYET